MEYSTDTAFTSPNPCTDTETTGLAEGTYYVRYKATATTEASNYVAVHVRLNTVTVVDGNGTTVTKHKSGTKRQPEGSTAKQCAFMLKRTDPPPYTKTTAVAVVIWCTRGESNPRHPASEAGALSN